MPSKLKMISLHEVVFEETFSCALAYTSRPYLEWLTTQPSGSYIPYDTYYHEQTGDIITFEQFEEENLLDNEHNLVQDK